MRRAILALCVAGVALLALAVGTARADLAFHVTFTDSGTVSLPAGTLCDFNEQEAFSLKGIETVAPNGQDTITLTEYAAHANLDTDYTLTEVDHINSTAQLGSSTFIQVGI
ncbi:MAG TPA: hypothetical protein VE757_02920, partial [Gaiellaceae bacterium]|nr:hypothetical protein [Gaiellaceae bacterium]